MSLERYFQRAHDEARRLLRDCPWLRGRSKAWPGFGFQRLLDRAMADTDGSPTLAAGEGAEARRLLGMVAWDRVPHAHWPGVFDTLRMAASGRRCGLKTWELWMRDELRGDGYLAEAAERTAA